MNSVLFNGSDPWPWKIATSRISAQILMRSPINKAVARLKRLSYLDLADIEGFVKEMKTFIERYGRKRSCVGLGSHLHLSFIILLGSFPQDRTW
jgi:hypothetical protein